MKIQERRKPLLSEMETRNVKSQREEDAINADVGLPVCSNPDMNSQIPYTRLDEHNRY